MSARLRGAIAAISAFVLSATPSAAADRPEVGLALNALSDPGPAPPFNAGDYTKYRQGSGTSTLVVHVKVQGAAGEGQGCYGTSGVLYPNTAYTRWMIETWARSLDGKPFAYYHLSPGDKATGIPVPTYLRVDDDESDSDLQMAGCNEYSEIVFQNVPAGNYIFVATTERFAPGPAREREGFGMAQTPFGIQPVTVDEGPELTGHMVDGFIVASHRDLKIEAGKTYTIAPQNVVPIAHVLPIKR